MFGFYEWLMTLVITAAAFLGVLWLVVRSAVRSGMRAAREDGRSDRRVRERL